MELPAPLKAAIDQILEGVPLADLQRQSEMLTKRYRAEIRDGRLHMADALAVKAYLAARMPATYAAVRASMDALAEAIPDFSPRTMLDIGAGPGTALWAAEDCFSNIESATLFEASKPVREMGERLAKDRIGAAATWTDGDITIQSRDLAPADLVTICYVLDEIAPASLPKLIDNLWQLTKSVLLIVEPGTPAGWKRILVAREQLIGLGAHVAAPCPHQEPCPLIEPDWCHFSRRVARSKLHRLTKGADVPWEDEKYIFLAVSREPAPTYEARILAAPRTGSGKVTLKLCQSNGTAIEKMLTKRDGEAFKKARKLDWGDAF